MKIKKKNQLLGFWDKKKPKIILRAIIKNIKHKQKIKGYVVEKVGIRFNTYFNKIWGISIKFRFVIWKEWENILMLLQQIIL